MNDRAPRVLVVDDDPSVREVAFHQLAAAGFVVTLAGSAEEALTAATDEQAELDLAIIDIVLPRMSGPALARRIRTVRPGLPVLFASGYAELSGGALDVGDLGLEEGVRLLPKPFDAQRLVSAARATLGKAPPGARG
jgi:two-component system cell cycle sensor histidine kinase/response regulator CckA